MSDMHDTSGHPSDELLFDYVEGEASTPNAVRVEQHLADCPECRELVVMAQAGGQVLGNAGFETMPAVASESLHRTIAEEWDQRAAARARHATPSWWSRFAEWRPAIAVGVATALVAVIAGGALLTSQLGDTSPKSSVSAKRDTTTSTTSAESAVDMDANGVAADSETLSGGVTSGEAGKAIAPAAAPTTARQTKPATETDDSATRARSGRTAGGCLLMLGHYNPSPKATIVEGDTRTFLGVVRLYCP